MFWFMQRLGSAPTSIPTPRDPSASPPSGADPKTDFLNILNHLQGTQKSIALDPAASSKSPLVTPDLSEQTYSLVPHDTKAALQTAHAPKVLVDERPKTAKLHVCDPQAPVSPEDPFQQAQASLIVSTSPAMATLEKIKKQDKTNATETVYSQPPAVNTNAFSNKITPKTSGIIHVPTSPSGSSSKTVFLGAVPEKPKSKSKPSTLAATSAPPSHVVEGPPGLDAPPAATRNASPSNTLRDKGKLALPRHIQVQPSSAPTKTMPAQSVGTSIEPSQERRLDLGAAPLTKQTRPRPTTQRIQRTVDAAASKDPDLSANTSSDLRRPPAVAPTSITVDRPANDRALGVEPASKSDARPKLTNTIKEFIPDPSQKNHQATLAPPRETIDPAPSMFPKPAEGPPTPSKSANLRNPQLSVDATPLPVPMTAKPKVPLQASATSPDFSVPPPSTDPASGSVPSPTASEVASVLIQDLNPSPIKSPRVKRGNMDSMLMVHAPSPRRHARACVTTGGAENLLTSSTCNDEKKPSPSQFPSLTDQSAFRSSEAEALHLPKKFVTESQPPGTACDPVGDSLHWNETRPSTAPPTHSTATNGALEKSIITRPAPLNPIAQTIREAMQVKVTPHDLRWEDPNFGELHLHIERHGNEVEVAIRSTLTQTHDTLRQHHAALADELSLDPQQLRFEQPATDGKDQGEQSQSHPRQEQTSRQGSLPGKSASSKSAHTPQKPRSSRPPNPNARVDLIA